MHARIRLLSLGLVLILTHLSAQEEAAAPFQRATDIIGSRVENREGDRLGSVDDVVVDLQSGQPVYVLVAAGLLGGIAGDLRPVPPEAFSVEDAALGIALVVDMAEDRWDQAPSIDQAEDAIRLGQETYATRIYEFYGRDWQERTGTPDPRGSEEGYRPEEAHEERRETSASEERDSRLVTGAQERSRTGREVSATGRRQPEREVGATEPHAIRREVRVEERIGQTAPPSEEEDAATREDPLTGLGPLMLTTDLLEFPVASRQREEIGQIEDLLISLSEAWIPFVLITPPERFWRAEDEVYAVPPGSLVVLAEEALLNIDPAELNRAAVLGPENFQEEARAQADRHPAEAREEPFVFRYAPDDEPAIFGGRPE